MTEEKMCGTRVGGGVASSPHRARSPVKVPQLLVQTGAAVLLWSLPGPPPLTHRWTLSLFQEQLVEAEPEHWLPTGVPKERRDGKKSAKLPETPKTAEEMWQHSVIGDYLAKYRVRTPPSAGLRRPRSSLTPCCSSSGTERPQEGPGGHGGRLEVHGEEGEDSLDQEGGGGPEALRG